MSVSVTGAGRVFKQGVKAIKQVMGFILAEVNVDQTVRKVGYMINTNFKSLFGSTGF